MLDEVEQRVENLGFQRYRFTVPSVQATPQRFHSEISELVVPPLRWCSHRLFAR